MRLIGKKIFGIAVTISVILLSSHALPHEKPLADQTSGPKAKIPAPPPDLAEIIPSATKLASRLVVLENKIASVLDMSEMENKFAVIEKNLKDPASQLQRLKDSKQTRFNKFIVLREAFEKERELSGKISDTLGKAIRKLSDWRN